MEPLAYRLRPKELDDIVGQKHLIGKDGIIRKLLLKNQVPSMILYGKPGIGKTTIANVICHTLNLPFENFNASTDNKAKLASSIEKGQTYSRFVLIVDEIHRMKKDIQDYLLPHLENGSIIMIGITTINPYHSVNPAIRSRCLVYKLQDLTEQDLEEILYRALNAMDPLLTLEDTAKNYFLQIAGGEVRTLINAIENASIIACNHHITLDDAKAVVQKSVIGIDKNEDSYYDTLSGLQKSIRGSDVDASLHYLAMLLTSDDLVSLTRRLSIIAYEDIGLANPQMGPKVKAACDVALDVGLPEAIIPLGAIVCDMALSPKSNSAYLAIHAALKDIEDGKAGHLPPHLKNTYAYDGKTEGYKYPHDYPGAWVDQQYLPDILKDVSYYVPKDSSKYEEALKLRYESIKAAKQKNRQFK